MLVRTARPRGFCAGVVRAIDTVRWALQQHGAPVYVYHDIVHNQRVVADLVAEGVVFVSSLTQIPHGSITIFSAHGVSQQVIEAARDRNLRVLDATCPLVHKVHEQARQYSALGYEVILIGHPGHDEVIGTLGQVDGPIHLVSSEEEARTVQIDRPQRVAYVTQTTLSVDDTAQTIATLERRFPTLQGPQLDDICYATQNRQQAVGALAQWATLVLVVGARQSSNANRLVEVAAQHGVSAHLVEDAGSLQGDWFDGHHRVGVSAAASTPEVLVDEVLAVLAERGCHQFEEMDGVPEPIHFSLPDGVGPLDSTKRSLISLEVAGST